jgi:hypothetical protein
MHPAMSRLDALSAYHEKLLAGAATLLAAGISYIGAILTDGEVRWVCITMASSILMAMLVAVLLRAPTESIKLTIARAGFAIMIGVLGTRELLIRWGIDAFEGDAIRLAGVAAAMTIAGMVLGYPLLLLANTKGKSWARILLDKIGPKAPSPPE